MSEAPKSIFACDASGGGCVVAFTTPSLGYPTEYTLTSSITAQLKAADELATDMMITIDNIRDAARTDNRWDGVAEKLQTRLTAYRKAKEQAQ